MVVRAGEVKKSKGKGKKQETFSAIQFMRTHSTFDESATGTKYGWKAHGGHHQS